MLTRLRIDGFKSLTNVDVRLGPFTCVAGPNGVGKSNLFDAITFLADLADKPLLDAALAVRTDPAERDKQRKLADVRSLFHLAGDRRATEMSFEAEMIVPREGVDDLGQTVRAATAFLRYKLVLAYEERELRLVEESLSPIKKSEVRERLGFPHGAAFRRSLGLQDHTRDFISTSEDPQGRRVIKLHQNYGSGAKSGGRPRSVLAASLPRTVLSSTAATESPTALLARREMQSWRLLQLEPSALRSPDEYRAPARIDRHGAHMPATLARLTHRLPPLRQGLPPDAIDALDENVAIKTAALEAHIANRLAELIGDVRSVTVEADDRRELLTLVMRDLAGTPCEARNLSDGTLRFLALAIIESDAETGGLLCLEEPENGIHPERIPVMLRLLQDIAVDPEQAVGADNPLRQLIVNTHSPLVAAQVHDDCLLLARGEPRERDGRRSTGTTLRWLSDTWRQKAEPAEHPVALGELLNYLGALGDPPSRSRKPTSKRRLPLQATASRRVMDRPDVPDLRLFDEAEDVPGARARK